MPKILRLVRRRSLVSMTCVDFVRLCVEIVETRWSFVDCVTNLRRLYFELKTAFGDTLIDSNTYYNAVAIVDTVSIAYLGTSVGLSCVDLLMECCVCMYRDGCNAYRIVNTNVLSCEDKLKLRLALLDVEL